MPIPAPIRKGLAWLWGQAIPQIAVPIAITVWVAIGATNAGMTMLEAGALAGITVGGLLAGIHYATHILDRAKAKRLANRTAGEIEAQIREWVYLNGDSHRRLPISEGQDFRILIDRAGADARVEVLKNTNSPILYCVAKVELSAVQQRLITPAAHADIAIEMLRLGVQFETRPNTASVFIQQATLFGESTSELDFYGLVMEVIRGVKMVQALVARLELVSQEPMGLLPSGNEKPPTEEDAS